MVVSIVNCMLMSSDDATRREYFAIGCRFGEDFLGFSWPRISRMTRFLTGAIGKHDQGSAHGQHPPDVVQPQNASTV